MVSCQKGSLPYLLGRNAPLQLHDKQYIFHTQLDDFLPYVSFNTVPAGKVR